MGITIEPEPGTIFAPSSTCKNMRSNTAMYEAVLDRHITAVHTSNLEMLMKDYHPDAVMINFDDTLCGIDAIRAFWIPVLNKSKGNAGQAAQSFIKKETVCDSGFDCVSYVHLNVEFASRATLIYNPRGQIVSHAWAAAFSAP